jgi:phosphoribosylglycinamide formyltransferase-1
VRVPVLPGDDVDTLGRRVLEREHALLVGTVGLVAAGRLTLSGEVVTLDGAVLATPLQLGANNQFP